MQPTCRLGFFLTLSCCNSFLTFSNIELYSPNGAYCMYKLSGKQTTEDKLWEMVKEKRVEVDFELLKGSSWGGKCI